MRPGGRPAVFLDRDGTLIEDRDYLADPGRVVLIPGTVGALTELRAAGYALVIVTNQSGIARGLYTESEYEAVTARLKRILQEAGVTIDAIYHCPHHPDVDGPCPCRKPGTGMHEQAARELGLDLAASWYVGDKLSDVLPAEALGGRGILVRTGYGRDEEPGLPSGAVAAADLAAAARHVLDADRGGGNGAGPD